MSLTKDDLKQIDKIVTGRIDERVEKSENKIVSVLSREIADLAEINRAVINRVDRIDMLEKRIIRLEERSGIRA